MPPLSQSFLCPILVGRATELESLTRLMERARTGPAQLALIAGEAGLGKSRLAAELKTHAMAQGFTVRQGHCFEPDRTLPYAPFLDLLRTFFATHSPEEVAAAFGQTLAAQTQNAAPLLALLPELADYLPSIEASSELAHTEPEQAKRRLFQTFTHFFSGASPLHLVLEDLHWCDETSLELLLHLIRRLSARPVLFTFTYRADEMGTSLRALVAELDRARMATELALIRLAEKEVEAMIRAIFGQAQPVRGEFVNAIHELTEGNPFFIEEVLKALVASGDIYAGATGWARKPISELHIPRTVQDAVERRVRDLSASARATLTLAAVAGRRFDFALLQKLTGHDEAELLTLLKELIAAQLVTEESAEVFAFRHALTRQAVYAGLLARERRTLHFTVAETMERMNPDAPGELAHQFFEAGVWGKALAYAQRAGESAQRLYAPRIAIEHFTRALTVAQTLAAPAPQPALFRTRGQAYETLGEFDSARADYEAELVHAGGDPRLEWQALLDLAGLWAARDYGRMGRYLEQASAAARQLNDPVALAHTLNRAGNWHMNVEHLDEALADHSEARMLFEQLDDQRGLAETYDLLAMTTAMAGDPLQGMAHYERAATLWRELDDRAGLGGTLTVLGPRAHIYFVNVAVWPSANLDERVRGTETALRLARETGSRPAEVLALAWLAQVWAMAGDYGRALELARLAVTLAEEIGHHQFMALAHWVSGALHLDLLALPQAQAQLEMAVQMARESEAVHWTRTAAGWLASTLVQQSQLIQAEGVLAEGLTPETPMLFIGQRHAWAALAELRLAQNRADEALKIVDRLIATAPNIEMVGEHAIPRLGLLRGETLSALSRYTEAEAVLRGAADSAATHDARGLEWRARAALARLYRAQGRTEDAEREAAAGQTIIEACAVSLGDEGLRANYIHRARESFPSIPALTARQSARKAFGGLTAREWEVAVRVAQGKANRMIAAELVVSERTVEKHVENIMGKLGFDSRVQVAVWASAKLGGVEKGVRE
ncbi:MAG: helix-turn-helix transcriptional regulator [Anaerolineales bacterium]